MKVSNSFLQRNSYAKNLSHKTSLRSLTDVNVSTSRSQSITSNYFLSSQQQPTAKPNKINLILKLAGIAGVTAAATALIVTALWILIIFSGNLNFLFKST
jgi:hypothetical protein